MRRMICVTMAFMMLFAAAASYAAGNTFMEIRNKFFAESKEIKSIFTVNKDIVLIASMWDTCMVVISQLDAYFYMAEIYNTIIPTQVTKVAVDSLIGWLKEIKKTNSLSLSLLNDPNVQVEPATMIRMESLKRLLLDLDARVDNELARLGTLSGLKKR